MQREDHVGLGPDKADIQRVAGNARRRRRHGRMTGQSGLAFIVTPDSRQDDIGKYAIAGCDDDNPFQDLAAL
jgi:hypothetical protein